MKFYFQGWFAFITKDNMETLLNSKEACGLICGLLISMQEADYIASILPKLLKTVIVST